MCLAADDEGLLHGLPQELRAPFASVEHKHAAPFPPSRRRGTPGRARAGLIDACIWLTRRVAQLEGPTRLGGFTPKER
jgi:hypothetical protein